MLRSVTACGLTLRCLDGLDLGIYSGHPPASRKDRRASESSQVNVCVCKILAASLTHLQIDQNGGGVGEW
jgi:hypothetical protein